MTTPAEDATIQLGQEAFTVRPFPLGVLRSILPAMDRASRGLASGLVDEAAFDDIVTVLAHALDKPKDELMALPATVPQLADAILTIARVCGLEARPEGEPAPGTLSPDSTPGTPSTDG